MSTLELQPKYATDDTLPTDSLNGATKGGHDCHDSPRPTEAGLPRVLHVINGEHYAGAERVQDLLAASLPAQGFQVGFACVKMDQFPEKRTCQHIPLFDLSMRRRFDFSAARKLAQIVADEHYRILHAHTPRSAMIARLAALLSVETETGWAAE